MTFSEKLITLRAGRGWSQERLAQELGITRQAVGRWEKGSGLPDAKSLMALARVFGVETEWLLDEDAASLLLSITYGSSATVYGVLVVAALALIIGVIAAACVYSALGLTPSRD